MTGPPLAPPTGPPDDPLGFHSDGRTPSWMRSNDEMGQMVVLVMRCQADEEESNAKSKKEKQLPEPFIIGSTVQTAVGEKAARSIIATREGRGSRYLLRTNSRSIVDKLKKLKELSDGTQIEVFLHPTLNTVQGIVYEPDSINTDEKRIETMLSSQGVKAVRRIKKRVSGKLQNTPLLVLTFHGTVLPKYVFFGLLRIQLRAYYPSPMICFNCGLYGHSRKLCQHLGICMQCSQPTHVADGERCNNAPYCLHCRNGHSITSRDCPKYKEEDRIIHMKVDQCISFTEARRRYNEENKRETIARTIQDQLKQEIAAKDQMIVALQKQVAALTKELASLKSFLMPQSQSQSSAASNTEILPTLPSEQSPAFTSSQSAEPSQKNNGRKSRKDSGFIPPADKRKESHDNGSVISTRIRSRSGKRQFEISPTNSNSKRDKRVSAQSASKQSSIDVDE